MRNTHEFIVVNSGDPTSKIFGFTDDVIIIWDSDHLDDEAYNDFISHCKSWLNDWFDGGTTYTKKEYNTFFKELEE